MTGLPLRFSRTATGRHGAALPHASRNGRVAQAPSCKLFAGGDMRAADISTFARARRSRRGGHMDAGATPHYEATLIQGLDRERS
jgi:hypothetical protein